MFCNQNQNSGINKLHHRALRVVYRDVVSPFEELLRKDGSVTIHHRNLHFLVTEIYMIKNGTTPSFMSDIFVRNNNANCISANTSSHSEFYNYINPTTTNYGIKTFRHLGPILWYMLPEIIKQQLQLNFSKVKTKIGCRFLAHVGYVVIMHDDAGFYFIYKFTFSYLPLMSNLF